MRNRVEDNALKILEDISNKKNYQIDPSIIREAYKIEKDFQYEKERPQPLSQLKKLIENHLSEKFRDNA